MQSKGAIKFVAILVALACVYQLSFTWATSHQEKKAEKYAEAAVEAVKQSAQFSKVADVDKAFILTLSLKRKTDSTLTQSLQRKYSWDSLTRISKLKKSTGVLT